MKQLFRIGVYLSYNPIIVSLLNVVTWAHNRYIDATSNSPQSLKKTTNTIGMTYARKIEATHVTKSWRASLLLILDVLTLA